ncbi:MAG: L-fuconolactonase [Mariniblastus sp.]|jgi:L-fuconolactonase
MIVDSHHHFWDRSLSQFDNSWQENPGLENICKTFLPEHLKPMIDAAGVEKTVFVQTQHNLEENRWILGLAEQHDWIAGVVGWVDLASPDCESQVEEFKDHPKFVGVRHVVQDEANDDFIVQDDVLRGLAVLEKHEVPFDLLFFVKHLKHAATVAQKFPNQKFVIDHLAKPVIKESKTQDWIENLIAAAACDNVWCKLSGMVTEADWKTWTPDDLKPYVDAALENFGVERCMFGSDWPVCELAANYQQVFDALTHCIGGVSESERARILGQNAIDFYSLKV